MGRTFVLILLMLLAIASVGRAEEVNVDLGKFAQELQRTVLGGGQFNLVWWIPTEYWQESFKHSPMTKEQKEGFSKAVEDYIVVAVVDGTLTPFGGIQALDSASIRKNISIKVGKGVPLTPLADDEIGKDTQTILTVMKPVFARILGEFGKGMELVCFKGKDAEGKRLVDPRENGQLTIKYGSKEHIWRLPLGSLLPPKYDAESGEQFPGNYLFNPFTGAKLGTTAKKQP